MEHVEISGDPYERGQQHGGCLTGLIRRLLEHERKKGGAAVTSNEAGLEAITQALGARCPDAIDELRGIADGAGVSYHDVLQLNAWYDAQAASGGQPACCTAIGLPGTSEGPLVAKTDDVPLDEREFEVFFRIQPLSGLKALFYGYGGTIWNEGGINEAGLAVAMTGIPGTGQTLESGVPSLIFLHELLLCCRCVDDALSFAESYPLRGHGCTMTLADATSSDVVAVENLPYARGVRRSGAQPTVCTNHYQYTETLALTPDGPPPDADIPGLHLNSLARARNARRLVSEVPWSVAGLKLLLSNHRAAGAICQHGQAGLHTSIAMILVPRQRAIIASEGYGCGVYVEHAL